MKLLAYPYGVDDFYIKPDTALAKPTDDFFIPPVCESITFATCYVIKINRLGRSIKEKFAHRYYSEINYGVCIYGHPKVLSETNSDLNADIKHNGSIWIPGLALDYSLSMPRTFLAKEQIEQISMQKADDPLQPDDPLQSEDSRLQIFPIPPVQVISKRIAHLSGFVYLKMGDLLLLELHKPQRITSGSRIRVLPEIDFCIR